MPVVDYILSLSGAGADLREKKVNTERCILVLEVALKLGDLFTQHVWGVSDTSNDTETTCIGDSSSELGAGRHVHASQHDGVVDLEKIGGSRP